MAHIYTSAQELIGKTPLLELRLIAQKKNLPARLLGKLEAWNPAGSAKDRYSPRAGGEKDRRCREMGGKWTCRGA